MAQYYKRWTANLALPGSINSDSRNPFDRKQGSSVRSFRGILLSLLYDLTELLLKRASSIHFADLVQTAGPQSADGKIQRYRIQHLALRL